jgi:hypothetical protein
MNDNKYISGCFLVFLLSVLFAISSCDKRAKAHIEEMARLGYREVQAVGAPGTLWAPSK